MRKASWLMACGFGLLMGCSSATDKPKLAPADGTVTYKGAPVANASVTFQPDKGPPASGSTDAQGKFTLATGSDAGAPVGDGVFLVHAIDSASATLIQSDAPAGKAPDPRAMMMQQQQQSKDSKKKPTDAKSAIPQKYSSPSSSGLQHTISEDAAKNHFELSLTD